MLDTGAEDDGVDELTIFGIDNLDPDFNGYVARHADEEPDRRHLPAARGRSASTRDTPVRADDAGAPCRRSAASPSERPTARRSSRCCTATRRRRRPRRLPQPRRGDEASDDVQRINYDAALNGRLSVYGLGGNDYFAADDNAAITTLDGGAGYDTFQIGQIFGLKRDEDSPTCRRRGARRLLRTTRSRRSSRRRAAG